MSFEPFGAFQRKQFCHFVLLTVVLFATPFAFCNPIHEAVRSGNLEQVKELLSSNPRLAWSVDDRGNTPLHYAAAGGFRDIAELLIDNGAYVNSTDKHGRTPLHIAASKGQKGIVELLLLHHADVNPVDDLGWTPMHTAAVEGELEIVDLLRKNGGTEEVAAPASGPPREHQEQAAPAYRCTETSHPGDEIGSAITGENTGFEVALFDEDTRSQVGKFVFTGGLWFFEGGESTQVGAGTRVLDFSFGAYHPDSSANLSICASGKYFILSSEGRRFRIRFPSLGPAALIMEVK